MKLMMFSPRYQIRLNSYLPSSKHIMKLNLLSCDAQRPDRRAISNCLQEISANLDQSSANELMDILLEGDAVEIEVDDKNGSSSFRALRKLNIDYEILD